MFFGLAPDQQWLAFTERMSRGPFARMEPRVFDPEHEFIPKYASRRANLNNHLVTSAKGVRDILVPAGSVPARITAESLRSAPPEGEPPEGEAPEGEPAESGSAEENPSSSTES